MIRLWLARLLDHYGFTDAATSVYRARSRAHARAAKRRQVFATAKQNRAERRLAAVSANATQRRHHV